MPFIQNASSDSFSASSTFVKAAEFIIQSGFIFSKYKTDFSGFARSISDLLGVIKLIDSGLVSINVFCHLQN